MSNGFDFGRQTVQSSTHVVAAVPPAGSVGPGICLSMLLAEDAAHEFDETDPQPVLVPNQVYKVLVSAMDLRSGGARISQNEDVSMEFEIAGGEGIIEWIEDPSVVEAWKFKCSENGNKANWILPCNKMVVDEQFGPFRFRLNDEEIDCPFVINLKHKSKLRLRLSDSITSSAPEGDYLSEFNVLDYEKRDKEWANLLVSRLDNNKIRIKGYHKHQKRHDFEIEFEPPEKTLADLQSDNVDTDGIRQSMNIYSIRDKKDLIKWLNDLVDDHQHKAMLLVMEQTETEIPWEMIEIDNGRFLGAEVIVARWLGVDVFAKARTLRVGDKNVFSGKPVTYLNRTDEDISSHVNAIKKYGSPCEKLAAWQKNLKQDSDQTSLAYAFCHGWLVQDNAHEGYFGSKSDPNEKMKPVDFADFKGDENSHKLVFINACNSARPISGNRTSLPLEVLSRIGSSFIGTLGTVWAPVAIGIGEELFQAASSDDGVRPAEFLRQQRAAAANKATAPGHTEEDWKNFVHTFLYIYYGHPWDKYRIDSEAGEDL